MVSEVQGGREEGAEPGIYIDLFTKDEIRRARSMSVNEIEEKIITKIMARIDRMTGQENLPRYMAYRLHYIASTHDD